MSLPKITTRPQRVIRTEYDPYLRTRPRTNVYIYRKVYEDGTSALFAGDFLVHSIHYDITRSISHPNAILDLEHGSIVHLYEVSPQECNWLEESMGDLKGGCTYEHA